MILLYEKSFLSSVLEILSHYLSEFCLSFFLTYLPGNLLSIGWPISFCSPSLSLSRFPLIYLFVLHFE